MASSYRKSEIPDHLQKYFCPLEMGLEPTLAEYIATMVAVMREVRRVLRDDGTLWLNIGDSYAATTKGTGGPNPGVEGGKRTILEGQHYGARRFTLDRGLKPKDLMMVPARLAIALQDDGWYLRSDIIWAKPNPMPESVRDRPTSAHEHIFLLTKRPTYFYDAEAIKEPCTPETVRTGRYRMSLDGVKGVDASRGDAATLDRFAPEGGRNIRNVWTIATQPWKESHFATFPPEIPRRCILAGTSERGQCPACGAPWVRVTERLGTVNRRDNGQTDGYVDFGMSSGRAGNPVTQTTGWQPSCSCEAGEPVPQTVLDPFLGAGTTLLVADRLGRNGIGIELNPEYAQMARKRITNDAPLFAGMPYEPPQTPQTLKQDALGKNTYTGFNERWRASQESVAD